MIRCRAGRRILVLAETLAWPAQNHQRDISGSSSGGSGGPSAGGCTNSSSRSSPLHAALPSISCSSGLLGWSQQRHASSAKSVDDFISKQLISCSSLGVLRRVMLRYKSNLEPDHVATLLLVLQHLVHLQRARKQSHPHQAAQQGVAGRVTAAREVSSRTSPRAAERDGPMQQLLAQIMGEAGAVIWQSMAEMHGPDLAKVLFSWASLDWQPEPQLYAQVSSRFLQAAAADSAASSSSSRAPDATPPGAAWLAAGLWGLCRLTSPHHPLDDAALALLQQHAAALLEYWTPPQLTDVATAMVAATESFEDDSQQQSQQQTAPVVLSLAAKLVQHLQQQQQQGAAGSSSRVAAATPWPAVLLLQQRPDQGQRGAEAAGLQPGVEQSAADARQLSWRMLQALQGAGVNVNEVQGTKGEVVLLLSQLMRSAAT